jgi:2-polyprenyl-3-methyl-5-hydroxy-6-metoxy-1,4-benzoquinol methylase
MKKERWKLIANPCLCQSEDCRVLLPEKIEWSALSAHEFSARRERSIQHYRMVRCHSCGLVRSDPILSGKDLAELYRDSEFLYPNESRYAARTYASLVTPYFGMFPRPEQIRLLEIGCGNGTFLDEMRLHHLHTIMGVEPSVRAVEQASVTVKPAIINDVLHRGFFPPEAFDVVCAFHVLDHLREPAEFIKECFHILNDKGIMVLVCHNVDALVNKVLGEYSPVFDVEHTFLFNPATLKKLVESCGFTTRNEGRVANTYPLSYWLRYAPIVNRFVGRFPRAIQNISLTLYAGNIYICAQKK